MLVRHLEPGDLDFVVARVASNLERDALRNPLINPVFSLEEFARALAHAGGETWVSLDDRGTTGHLYGAILSDTAHGTGAWVGPDGVSFDTDEVLTSLYATAATTWLERGATEHYVWVRDDEDATRPWYELGFARVHAKGVVALHDLRRTTPPAGCAVRRGGAGDLDAALALERVLDDAERRGPSFQLTTTPTSREEWEELLADEEVRHYVVECDGDVVAQCVTYPLPPQRGSFHDTLHISAVVVAPNHEHRGVARALLGVALEDARETGFRYAETTWRVTNRRASHFWRRYGFRTTYVRLHRTVATN
jgi:ribosomal protein S18 acetylase RimI-like enzyme